jgi:hypothetical protein
LNVPTTLGINAWRDRWQEYTEPPDGRDHARERAFLSEHANYGATIHRHTADVIFAALEDELNATKRHALTLRLFAEFANGLESLAAWGWSLQRRRTLRLFLDGFLSYPLGAAEAFYRDVLERAAEDGVVELLDLPPRAEVIRDARALVPASSARDVGEYLNGGMQLLQQSAEQYFVGEMVLVRHYNRAKHGTSMIRLDEYTNNEFDFQLIAPEWRRAEVANGAWYNIGLFRADEAMVGRLHRNIEAVTHSIRFMANVAWALYRAGHLYAEPDPEAR